MSPRRRNLLILAGDFMMAASVVAKNATTGIGLTAGLLLFALSVFSGILARREKELSDTEGD
jgi:hypothetical protein